MIEHLTRGVNCATLTPMDASGDADLDLLAEHCRWLLESGCDGIVVLGTTGEANSFTVAERKKILEGVLERGIAATRLIVGTGCCAAGDSVTLTKHALASGVTRVLMLPPFYYKNVDEQGVIDAYARTIEAVGDEALRLYLYQIPQLTGVSLGPSVIEALVETYPRVMAGIKDSSGDWSGIAKLCERFGKTIDVLVGSERYLIAGLKAGASGCVTATANAHPAMISRLYREREDGRASVLQDEAAVARGALEAYPMIAALKEITAARTGNASWRNVRPPLTPLHAASAEALHVWLAATRLAG
jgi:4-hydroxy-tetrahydrodipicolinate synthase